MAGKRLETIGDRLKWAREKRGFGSRELCERAGLSSATVSVLESGRRIDVGISTAKALADVLGVPPEWLAWGRGDPGI